MITRLVKLSFIQGKGNDFLTLFETFKEQIANQPGCTKLELLHDTGNPDVFFTFSVWQSEQDLEAYRHSEVFRRVWPQVKPWFREQAEAWSTIPVSKNERH